MKVQEDYGIAYFHPELLRCSQETIWGCIEICRLICGIKLENQMTPGFCSGLLCSETGPDLIIPSNDPSLSTRHRTQFYFLHPAGSRGKDYIRRSGGIVYKLYLDEGSVGGRVGQAAGGNVGTTGGLLEIIP